MTPAHLLGYQMRHVGLTPELEHKFHPTRKWRFDFSWPALMFAVEVEGGIYVSGRHTRGTGFEKDLEKYAEAMFLGWQILRVGDKQITSGRALEIIESIIARLEDD